MTDPNRPAGPPTTVSKKEVELLQLFSRDAFEPVQSGSHDLVSITMNGLFEVTAVQLSDAARTGTSEKLAQAIKEAINAAVREVARRNAERIAGAAPRTPAR